ncbi:unnamed protein product, partial [Brassica oleracea]
LFFSIVVCIDKYAETAVTKILIELKPCNLIMYLTKLQGTKLYHRALNFPTHPSATNLYKKQSQKISRQQQDSMTSLLDGKPNESNVKASTIFY